MRYNSVDPLVSAVGEGGAPGCGADSPAAHGDTDCVPAAHGAPQGVEIHLQSLEDPCLEQGDVA